MTDTRNAAVVVPLDHTGTQTEDARLGLVSRSADSSEYGGHIGFPGGKPELGDETMLETARRELLEEIQVQIGDFEIGDPIDIHQTRSSSFDIHPFPTAVSTPERFLPASREIEETFWIPATTLREGYTMDGDRIRYLLQRPPQEVWGVTARIITSLLVANPSLEGMKED